MPISSALKVLFMASEADPLIKVGGLGDVAGSLPRALRALNPPTGAEQIDLDIRLVIPFHPSIRADLYSPQQVSEFPVHSLEGDVIAKVFSFEIDGLPVYLISGAPIDNEAAVYSVDLKADGYKYVFFSLAALTLPKELNWQPSVLHANDWHTATAVYAFGLQRSTDQFFSQTKSILTIHNLPYLGAMTSEALDVFELPPADHSDLPPWAQHMALPLGLLSTDSIVAVSPGYSREILTDDFGSGLHKFLKAHHKKITGILNGLDTVKWDPLTDVELTQRYSVTELSARADNKSFLQQEVGLEIDPAIFLLAMVTRMDPQKGVDLSVAALRLFFQSSSKNTPRVQAVFLGTGNPLLEASVRQLEEDFPDQVRACISYNTQLSRHIYAGADVLLMPSRYEPCGLSQMIAMRYGCVPVARATGGLSDTIQDVSTSDRGTGFLFENSEAGELVDAIQHALTIYTKFPHEWEKIKINGMQQDFSWDRSAQDYLKQYRLLTGK